ncbi:MAG: hypothetical protein JWQ89_2253 [Devosia sp.]|uniref:hypothetical protein n=1 Tax=Devosia sp. TaxID=1871048 RepID=UPI00261FF2FA|nr:hypothetical protein [Devosia sp.]MDB5540526.1 hypothetical protein [Devosia sp.]
MADISITAANVLQGADARIEHGTFGATLAAGQVVYEDAADSKYKLADNDSATAAAKVPVGITLNGGANGQPGTIQKGGDITVGGTLVPGTTYCLSSTPGGICPQADLNTSDAVVILGVAKSASVLDLNIQISGVTL